ncbi:MAG: helix-turn-helix transcriptional regulator [Actinomycetota bacterium]
MTTDPLDGAALLAEPTRRALYLEIGRRGELSRDAAARAVGISRSLAAFHLDRLAEAGLVGVEYRRLSGRSGPGAGRPAKLYRRTADDLAISVPPRDYELAARILAEAVESGGTPTELRRTARRIGRDVGRDARGQAGNRPSRARLTRSLVASLRGRGFEPTRSGDHIRLSNCPFDALVARSRDSVCSMNLAFLTGIAEGAGVQHLRPVADRQPGMCCVSFRPSNER